MNESYVLFDMMLAAFTGWLSHILWCVRWHPESMFRSIGLRDFISARFRPKKHWSSLPVPYGRHIVDVAPKPRNRISKYLVDLSIRYMDDLVPVSLAFGMMALLLFALAIANAYGL